MPRLARGLLIAFSAWGRAESLGSPGDGKPRPVSPPLIAVYRNDFNGKVGQAFDEWTSSRVAFHKTKTDRVGTLAAGKVVTAESPNRRDRFLGEFGGPPIGQPGDRDWNQTRVDQTVILSLKDLEEHTRVVVSFDLYVLKSWDGNSRGYGPDRFVASVAGGPVLLETTFSNNPKVREDGSDQCYPGSCGDGSRNPPRTRSVSTGSLGYDAYFKESVYHLAFEFPHAAPMLQLEFSSSLFEAKGTGDESWGLDNVAVSADVPIVTKPIRR